MVRATVLQSLATAARVRIPIGEVIYIHLINAASALFYLSLNDFSKNKRTSIKLPHIEGSEIWIFFSRKMCLNFVDLHIVILAMLKLLQDDLIGFFQLHDKISKVHKL